MKILVAQTNPTVGDYSGNLKKIVAAIEKGREAGVDLVVFSELVICGYPPDDLLLLPSFVEACERTLKKVIAASEGLAVIIGTVRKCSGEKPLYNSAAIIADGALIGYQDKSLLPTYDVFDEQRYFEPASESRVWNLAGHQVAVTICEDIWTATDRFVSTQYTCDPIDRFDGKELDLFINLSASPYSYEKPQVRNGLMVRNAARLGCPAVLCNQVGGNDSLIFDGNSIVVDQHGTICAQAKAFEEELLFVDTKRFSAPHYRKMDPIEELYFALVCGLRDYCRKCNFKTVILGLSGGIDSALVAALAVEALGKENVFSVAMPSRFSTDHSKTDAYELARILGIPCSTIPIEEVYATYEKLLTPHFEGKPWDTTEENLQARIRGMILMALSNKHGHLVLSTGNKSETAIGYATLYGDMAGGLAVINDVSKTQVYELCRWMRHQIPQTIIDKPPSAELREDQLDSDTLPDYAIIDQVLEDYVEKHLPIEAIIEKRDIPPEVIISLVNKIHLNEYKRRQAPPGLRVSEKAFSIGRRFPIVHKWLPFNPSCHLSPS